MSEYKVDLIHLETESDVEQKVIYPLITKPEPTGLGFDLTEIKTKSSLRKLLVDKGNKAFLYYPDFLINVNGVPSLIIEAKKPGEDLVEAFRQAALYAAEINRQFDSKVNPCQLVIACDGSTLYAGTWDNKSPEFEIPVEDWLVTDGRFSDFCEKFGKSGVTKLATEFRAAIKPRARFKRPLNLLGGKFIRDRENTNAFGENISIQYQHLFNPSEEDERVDVVRNAYIKVQKHQTHVSPIDKLIRKKVSLIADVSTEIVDTVEPKQLLEKLAKAREYNNQVLLLIGNVGSGKSTFTTYLREVALDDETRKKLVWVVLDLNNAPVSADDIYQWVKSSIISQIKSTVKNQDFDSLAFIQHLYHHQIEAFKKGPITLLEADKTLYAEKIYEQYIALQSDIDTTLNSYIQRYVHDLGKELIVVLDNCDKRNLSEQLLMFEVASWVKNAIKSIVFLPLRDTTFDHFRKEKPLDTVIKDLTFRITPPPLEKVLFGRIRYASRLSEKSTDRFYVLPNGMRVQYPSADELYYLRSILTSLFQSHYFKRLISGLTGGDIRLGLEIFLDFCKSGYISESDIFKMRQSKGEYKLPNHRISKVFLRGNRLYYSDVNARIKSVFACDPTDELPDPFVRISILKWLENHSKARGPSGIPGYHKVETMFADLVAMGHNRARLNIELHLLLRNGLVENESQDSTKTDNDELISIKSPGLIHLELLTNADYLSSCAEDMWYQSENDAEKIASIIGGVDHLSLPSVVSNGKTFVNYLRDYYGRFFKVYEEHLDKSEFLVPVEFNQLAELFEDLELSVTRKPKMKFFPGTVVPATVTRMTEYGVIINLNHSGVTAYVDYEQIIDKTFMRNLRPHDLVDAKILSYDRKLRQYTIEIFQPTSIAT